MSIKSIVNLAPEGDDIEYRYFMYSEVSKYRSIGVSKFRNIDIFGYRKGKSN